MTMTEQFLNGPNVIATFQQMRRKTVPQHVTSGVFRDSGASCRTLDGFLNDGFVDVMTPLSVRGLVEIPAAGRKYELPTPLGFRIRIFSRYRIRERYVSCAFSKIPLVESSYMPQVLRQGFSR